MIPHYVQMAAHQEAPDNPSGKPFEDQDYGWTMRIYSVGDCKEKE